MITYTGHRLVCPACLRDAVTVAAWPDGAVRYVCGSCSAVWSSLADLAAGERDDAAGTFRPGGGP